MINYETAKRIVVTGGAGPSVPDISLAKKHLKWQPSVKLDNGLKKTIEYFDKLLRNKIFLAKK